MSDVCKNLKKNMRAIIGVFVFLAAFLWIFYFARRGVDSHHTGVVLKNAIDVASGKILYLESFSQYGFVQTYILAFFIKIFGKHIWVALFSASLVYALSYVLFYLIISKYINPFFSVIISAVLMGGAEFYVWEFHPWSNIYGLFFLLLCACLYVRYNETGSKLCAGLASVSAYLAFYSKLPIGIVIYVAVIFILIFKKLVGVKIDKGVLAMAIGTTAILNLITFFLFYVNNALPSFFKQTFSDAVKFGTKDVAKTATATGKVISQNSNSGTVESILELAEKKLRVLIVFAKTLFNDLFVFDYYEAPTLSIISVICVIGFIVFIILVKKIRKQEDKDKVKYVSMFIFLIFALGSWGQYYPVSCIRHVTWGIMPMVAVSVMLIKSGTEQLMSQKIDIKKAYWIGTVIATVAIMFVYAPIVKENATYIKWKNINFVHEVKDSEMFEYIYLTEEEALYYSDFEDKYRSLIEKDSERSFVNYSLLNIFSCYDNFVSVGPAFSLYGSNQDSREEMLSMDAVIVSDRIIEGDYVVQEIAGSNNDLTGTGSEIKASFYIKN